MARFQRAKVARKNVPGTIFFFSLTELIYNLMIVERVLRNRKDARQATENTCAVACQQEDAL